MVKILRKGEPIKIHILTCWADKKGIHGYDFLKEPTVYKYFKMNTPNNSGRWGRIELVEDFYDADLYCCFRRARKEPKMIRYCPPHTVINFCREPMLQPNPNQIGEETLATWTVNEHYNPQEWWVWKTYDELISESFPEKTKLLSFITTGRHRSKGHKFRLKLLEEFTKKYPNVLDLYGNPKGRFDLTKIPEYKGYIRDKWEGLSPYRYSIAIEKTFCPHYFSEKLIDPILAGCMPIYQGCQKIDEYFPKGAVAKIDITREDVVDQVWNIINSDYRESNLEALREAKELILNKYQVMPTFNMAINLLIEKGVII